MSQLWKPWQYSSKEDLAHYVIPNITRQLNLTIPNLTSVQADTLNGREKVLAGLYNWLCQQGIEYDYEPFSTSKHRQDIRTPQEILQTTKKGTCLDLAVLFAGLCLEFRLLPLVVIQEEHSFVMVNLPQNRAKLEDYMHKNGLFGGIILPSNLLSNLNGYLAIECTGFARTHDEYKEGLPDSVSRRDGLLSFDDAVSIAAGHRLVEGDYALNVAYFYDIEDYQAHPLPQPSGPPRPMQKPPRHKPFVDRKDELATLLAQLKPGETVTLCGPGGMGKTALASEAIWQLAPAQTVDRFPDGIINHSFYDFPQTDIALQHIITSLGGQAEPPLELTAKRLLTGKRLLLLLDGAEDADNLKRLRDITPTCGVIITSRKRADAPTPQQRQDITPLPNDEALTLLETLISTPSTSSGYASSPELAEGDTRLAQIRDLLGGWPLAVNLAGRYLAETGEPLADYLAWLEESPFEALHQGDHRQESAALLLERTLHRLSEEAKSLLALTGLLALAPFKRDWLTGALDKSYSQLRPALNELVGYGLLLVVEDTHYQLSHALIHSYVGEYLQPTTEFMEQLEQVLLDEANELNKAGYPLALTWSGHLRTLTDLALEQGHPSAADLANTLGYYLNSIANYEGARPYYEQALAICREVLGERHPSTATNLNNLGALLDSMGDYEGARPYYEQGLAIRREVLGERHPDTAQSLNNLGFLLQAMGDYEGARPYLEQGLAIVREVLGERHPSTATSLNNLGALLQAMGDYEGARPYYEQGLAIVREVLGERHPSTASSLNNLGMLLKTMGDYEGARPYYEQALAIFREVLGERHPDTAQSLNNLGVLLKGMGDYEGARSYLEQGLAIRREVLGERHPDTAQSLNNLGFLLQTMGDYEGARPYYEQALAIFREVLGERHPSTATNLNNLGFLLKAMGDYEGARPYYEQGLAIRREVLGERHPSTASSLNNLGALLQTMGDYEGARPYYEQGLAINREVLGERHPDTASSLNNLGGLLQAMGDYEGARPYYEQGLAIRREVLGERHPDTALSLNNLAILCYYQQDFSEAARLMAQALAILEAMLGPNHPHTVSSRQSLASIEAKL